MRGRKLADIKYSNCCDSFTIDESGYTKVLQQVRNDEFEREIGIRRAEFEKCKKEERNLRLTNDKARELSIKRSAPKCSICKCDVDILK